MLPHPMRTLRRAALQLAIAALGIAMLVGSGGGAGLDDSICDVYPDACGPQPPPPPSLSIDPPSLTVQVGAAASFVATVAHGTGTYSYQWRRSADGGTTFENIPGATSPTLALPTVNLADDGAVFMALAWQGTAAALQATAALAVSSTPGVVFTDQDFAPARWQATAAISPGSPTFTHEEAQSAADGHPGAYRAMTVQIAPGSGVSTVTHLSLVSTYDPSVQGAIRALDHAEDCILLQPSYSTSVDSAAFIEQNGRRYLAIESATCGRTGWSGLAVNSLRPQDFRLFDGPACGANESCPDFSAAGAPLRLGYLRRANGAPGETLQHGIDNWKITVWRR